MDFFHDEEVKRIRMQVKNMKRAIRNSSKKHRRQDKKWELINSPGGKRK